MDNIKKTLGLDLGSNSLGWAIANSDTGEILDTGVVIFEEGIKRENGVDTLETPAAARRVARMGRRLKMRRRYRKFAILKTLINNGMCPLSMDNLEKWKKAGVYPLNDKAFMQWLSSTPEQNPYVDRARAASEKVDKYTLGRAMYHLVQRRGFLSTRKDKMKDDGRDKDLGKVKGAIQELTTEIELFNEGATLGQYFYDCFKNGKRVRARYIGRKEHYEKEFAKIIEVQQINEELAKELHRNIFYQRPLRSQKKLVGFCPLEPKYRRCQIFRPEFEEFRMLTMINNLRVKVGDFDKRFLTEDEKKKAIKKFYVVANYFKIKDLSKAIGKDIVLNYNENKTVPSCSVSQQLNNLLYTKKEQEEGKGFEDWSYKNEREGKKYNYDYNTILDAISFFDDDEKLFKFAREKLGFNSEQAEKLLKIRIPDGYAKYSLKAIKNILPFLREGYDLFLSQLFANIPSIVGKSNFESNKEKILKDIVSLYDDFKENCRQKALNRKVEVIPFKKRLKIYLENKFNVTEDKFKLLYFNSSDYKDCKEVGILPPVQLGMIRNPLVQRSLTIMRRLVNQLRISKKIDGDTHIHVELARSVNNRNTRLAYEDWQNEKEKKRLEYADKIREAGKEPTNDLILRWQLAEEQGWKCMYTGRKISLLDVLGDGHPFDIEHTIPRSKSGDDSQANKTLCDACYNREEKKGMLPTQCPNWDKPTKKYDCVISTAIKPWIEKVERLEKDYENQLSAAKKVSATNLEAKSNARRKALKTKLELGYWRAKVRRFTVTYEELGDFSSFMNRQLVDTGIMTSHAIEFLGSVYYRDGNNSDQKKPNVWPVNGSAVALARKCWGVQDPRDEKIRDNHVHHAIDAMVIAQLNHKRFEKICGYLKDDGQPPIEGLNTKIIAPPFEEFGQKVHDLASQIFVKHLSRHTETKQTKRNVWDLSHPIKISDKTTSSKKTISKVSTNGDTVRGQLHKETFFGRIKSPESGELSFVVRKSLDAIEEKNVDKIVDSAVRDIIKNQIEEYKQEHSEFKWKEFVANRVWMKKPNPDGSGGVEIKKVRIYAHKSSANELKPQIFKSDKDYKNVYYVDSGEGSNYEMGVYENGLLIDNILNWAQRKNKEKIDVPENYGAYLGKVSSGTMAIILDKPNDINAMSVKDVVSRLYVIYKYQYINGKYPYVYLKRHNEALPNTELEKLSKKGGNNKVDFSDVNKRQLYLNENDFLSHTLIEGIHFTISIDGDIELIER